MPDERYAKLPALRDSAAKHTDNNKYKHNHREFGRPSKYNEAVVSEICARLADGEPLIKICSSPHLPSRKVVIEWLAEGRADFRDRYARAREAQADLLAEQIVTIADDDYRDENGVLDGVAVQQARLRVDARKWITSKIMPKRYGDRVEVSGDPDRPLVQISRIEIVAVEPGALPPPPKVIDHED